MNKQKYAVLVAAVGFVASAAVALPAFAQIQASGGVGISVQGGGGEGNGQGSGHVGAGMGMNMDMRGGMGMINHGIFGTVSAINGDTLTVTSKMPMRMGNATTSSAMGMTYTVDATNATVVKGGVSSTLSSVAITDMVFVEGAVNGTNITATVIRDGVPVPGAMGGHGGMPGGFGGRGGKGGDSSSTPRTPTSSPIQGNGEPVVAGKVTAVSGTTITVTNASNVTYTIDAGSAKIVENGTTTAITNIATGDNLVVQGAVNGTSVTASSVIDQGAGAQGGGSTTKPSGVPQGGGFLGAIGNFFKHIFGF